MSLALDALRRRRLAAFLTPLLPLIGAVFLLGLDPSPRPGAAADLAVDVSPSTPLTTTGTYALTVQKAGAGSGYVYSSLPGIDCGANCWMSYASGATVTLSANAEGDSLFAGWSGPCAGSGDCILTMDADKVVTATFALGPRPNLRVVEFRVEPSYAAPNQPVAFTALISNASDVAVMASFGTAIGDGYVNTSLFPVFGLAPHASLVFSTTTFYQWPGAYRPWVEVDAYSGIAESDEGDNRRVGQVTIGTFAGPPKTNLAVDTWVSYDFGAGASAVGGQLAPQPAVAPGQIITYQVAYSNRAPTTDNPPGEATGIVLTDRLPFNFSFAGSSPPLSTTVTPSDGGQIVRIELGRLGIDESRLLTLAAQVGSGIEPGRSVTNAVEIGANEPDRSLDDNRASATVRVGPFPNLVAAGLTFDPPNPATGQPVTLTATISNTGSVAVTSPFTAAFDSGLDTIFLPVGGLGAQAATTVVRSAVYLAPGSYHPTVTLDPDLTVAELNDFDNQVGTTLEITGADLRPNLAIAAISREPIGPVGTGTQVVFTVEIGNPTDVAVTKPFTVAIDTGRTVATIPSGGLGPNSSQTLAYTTVYRGPGWVYPSVTVDSSGAVQERDEGDNYQAVPELLVYGAPLEADLGVGTAWSFSSGRTVAWNVTVFNNSPSRVAEQVVVTNTLPDGFAFLDWYDRPRTGYDDTCTCEKLLGDDVAFVVEPVMGTRLVLIRPLAGWLPPSYEDHLVLSTTAPIAAVGAFTNTVHVSSTTPDDYVGNNDALAAVTLDPLQADLGVAQLPSYQSGRTVAWAIDVSNASANAVMGVVVTATLPDGFTLVGWYDQPRTVWDFTCSCGLPMGDDVPFAVTPVTGTQQVAIRPADGQFPEHYADAIVVTTTAGASLVGTFTSTVAIAGMLPDPVPSNNQAASAVTLDQPRPDLAVATWLSYRSGQTIAWNVEVSNDGGDAATGVVATQTLPTGLTFVGWYDRPRLGFASGAPTGDDVGFDVEPVAGTQHVVLRPANGVLPSSYRDSLVITTTAAPGLVGTLTNTVVIAGTLPDPAPWNNRSEATITLEPASVDLVVEHRGGVTAAGEVFWRIGLGNLSAEDAQDAAVIETLPDGFALAGWYDQPRVRWDDTCGCEVPRGDDVAFTVEPVPGTLQVRIQPASGVLPAEYSDVIVLTTTATAGLPPPAVKSTVEITSSTPERDPTNNAHVAGLTIGGADVGVKVWLHAFDGQSAVWKVRFWNDATSGAAEGVVVTATLPAEFTLATWIVPSGDVMVSVQPIAGTSTVLIQPNGGLLPAGSGSTVDLVTTAAAGLTGPVTSTVAIGTTTADLKENNTDSASLFVSRDVWAHTSRDQLEPVAPGQTLAYVLEFGNDGTGSAPGVQIVDTIPPSMTVVGWFLEPRLNWISPTLQVLEPQIGYAIMSTGSQLQITPLTPDQALPPSYLDRLVVTMTLASEAPFGEYTNRLAITTTGVEAPAPGRALRANSSATGFVLGGQAIEQREIQLTAGWNLLTLPLAPVSLLRASSLLQQLADAGMEPKELVRWQDGHWASHLRGFPVNDFELRPGEGFFVRVGQGKVWTFTGLPLASAAPIAIAAGWTAIGLPYNGSAYYAEDVLVELSSQGVDARQLVRWQNGMWQSHVRGFAGSSFPLNRTGSGPEQAMGYFVRSDGYTTWTPAQPPTGTAAGQTQQVGAVVAR